MTRRTFTRRFKQVMGVTAGEWLLCQRLALAQQLLETSASTVETIAEAADFGSAVSLREHFNKAFKISPSNYRRNSEEVDASVGFSSIMTSPENPLAPLINGGKK